MNTKVIHGIRRDTQVSVFLDDRPGTLGRITGLLGRESINIYGLSVAEGVDHGYIRMVTSDADRTAELFREAGFLAFTREVLLLEIDNEPGALGMVARAWGQAGVNIDYAYCAGGPRIECGLIVVRVGDISRAVEAAGPLMIGKGA